MATVQQVDRLVKYTDEVLTLLAEDTVEAAATKMADNKVGCLVVVDAEKAVVGILTERDIIHQVTIKSADAGTVCVAEIMTTNVVSCTTETEVGEAQQLMVEHHIRHIPIVENGVLVGIVSSRDIIAYQLSTSEAMKIAAERVAKLSKGLKHLDYDELINLTVCEVPKIFDAEWGVLCFPKDDCPVLNLPTIRRHGCPCPKQYLTTRSDVEEMHQNSQVVLGDIPCPCERLGGRSPKVVIPLVIGDSPANKSPEKKMHRGYLCICRFPSGCVDTNDMLRYTSDLLKDVLSANLTNAVLYQEARRSSETDSLTGTYTRKLFEMKLEEECARTARYKNPICVGMVDIDHLKGINDAFGHSAGDKVLGYMGEIMRQGMRTSDLCARYGGDEFVLLMPETRLDEAVVILERLQNRIGSFPITPDGQRFTISCGVIEWAGDPEETGDNLLHQADEALYKAKRMGRNRIVALDTKQITS